MSEIEKVNNDTLSKDNSKEKIKNISMGAMVGFLIGIMTIPALLRIAVLSDSEGSYYKYDESVIITPTESNSKLENIEPSDEFNIPKSNKEEVDRIISNIERVYLKERNEMELLLKENVLSEKEAQMIFTHIEDRKNKEIAKVINEHSGYEKVIPKSLSEQVMDVTLISGHVIRVILSDDEEINDKSEAHSRLLKGGYEQIKLSDISNVETFIEVDTSEE